MSETPSDPTDSNLKPGDEAQPGTEGASENLCPKCSGAGRMDDGEACSACAGTGVVTEGIGGA